MSLPEFDLAGLQLIHRQMAEIEHGGGLWLLNLLQALGKVRHGTVEAKLGNSWGSTWT
jgi:hypothetical protein